MTPESTGLIVMAFLHIWLGMLPLFFAPWLVKRLIYD